MKPLGIFLIAFWAIVIIFPEVIAYLIWGFLIFIGVNLITFFKTTKSKDWDNYVKFGNYKIFR